MNTENMHTEMNGSRPILVPIELTESANAILSKASELARSLSRPLVVLHVVHDSVEIPGQYVNHEHEGVAMPMIEVARGHLDRLVSTHPELDRLEGLRTVLVEGLPARRILEAVEREEPEMIVMGSHGRSGVSRFVSGSIAETVTRASRVPVTIVKSAQAAPAD